MSAEQKLRVAQWLASVLGGNNSSDQMKAAAIDALEQGGLDKNMIDGLIKMAMDKNNPNRSLAIKALGRLGASHSEFAGLCLEALSAMLSDKGKYPCCSHRGDGRHSEHRRKERGPDGGMSWYIEEHGFR